MVKSFKDFLNEKKQSTLDIKNSIVESAGEGALETSPLKDSDVSYKSTLKAEKEFFNSIPQDYILGGKKMLDYDSVKNPFAGNELYNNRILSAAAMIVLKHLKKANAGFILSPLTIKVNGEDAAWLYILNGADYEKYDASITLHRNKLGEKVLSYYGPDFNGKDNAVAEFTLASDFYGFKDMIEVLIDKISGKLNESLLVEAAFTERDVDDWGAKQTGVSAMKMGTKKPGTDIVLASSLGKTARDIIFNMIQSFDTGNGQRGIAKAKVREKLNELVNTDQRGIFASLKGQPTLNINRIADAYIMSYCGEYEHSCPYIYHLLSYKNPETGIKEPVQLSDIVVKSDESGNLKPVLDMSKIKVSTDVDTDVEDPSESEDFAMSSEYDECREEYHETMRQIQECAEAMCRYVKSEGTMDVKKEGHFRRGMYITGKPGYGKTYTIEKALENNHMREGIDYCAWAGHGTQVEQLYDGFYEYNGKLVIMDDAAKVVSGALRIEFWKNLLQTQGGFAVATYDSAGKDKYYDVKSVSTRKQRYFLELGLRSKAMTATEVAKMKKSGMSQKEIEEELASRDLNAKPAIPNRYDYTGCIIIISNMTEKELEQEVLSAGGRDDWKAIKNRFGGLFVINPPSQVIWTVIKDALIKQRDDEERPDDLCLVPKEYVDMLIDLVERAFNGEFRRMGEVWDDMSWRLISFVGPIFRDPKITDKERDIKSALRTFMCTKN